LLLTLLFTIFLGHSPDNLRGDTHDRQLLGSVTQLPKQNLSVVFIGDSLIEFPRLYHDFYGKLRAKLPAYNLTFTSYAAYSNTISMVLNDQLPLAMNMTPDAYFLLWDSDIANRTPEEDTARRRSYYRANLTFVLGNLTSKGSPYVSVSGPGLLGEGVMFMPEQFWMKQHILNDHRRMNRDLCAGMSISYLDYRQALLEKLPWWRSFSRGWLTFNGEHPNEEGANILVELLVNDWKKNWLPKIAGNYFVQGS